MISFSSLWCFKINRQLMGGCLLLIAIANPNPFPLVLTPIPVPCFQIPMTVLSFVSFANQWDLYLQWEIHRKNFKTIIFWWVGFIIIIIIIIIFWWVGCIIIFFYHFLMGGIYYYYYHYYHFVMGVIGNWNSHRRRFQAAGAVGGAGETLN